MPGLRDNDGLGTHKPLLATEAEGNGAEQEMVAALTEKADAGIIEEKPDMLETLQVFKNARGAGDVRPWQSMVSLVVLFCREKTKKMTEIWILICMFFYIDLLLDIRMMFTFWQYGDKYFCLANTCGIAAGALYTLCIFQKDVTKDDTPFLILMCGFLLPFQMHVLFLCCYSAKYLTKAHPLLHAFKLAESAIEATMSACVQSYAMIFRNLHYWDYIFTFLSCASSYASIAFVFAQLDRSEAGLQGLPGISQGWCLKMGLVLLFRACEVLSRVISLSLFQLAVRNEVVVMGFSFGIAGGLSVIVFDFLLMFTLISIIQGVGRKNWFNCVYSILSVVVFINPLLLKDNAFTLPCWLYYTVRFAELSFMGAVAWKAEVFHAGKHFSLHELRDHNPDDNLVGLAGFQREFFNDSGPVYAFLVATLLMMVLLPVIRFVFAENVLLLNKKMFKASKFNISLVFLTDKLMSVKNCGDDKEERRQCEDFHTICQDIVKTSTSRLSHAINHNPKGKLRRQSTFAGSPLSRDEGPPRMKSSMSMSMLPEKKRCFADWEGLVPDVEGWLDRTYEQALDDWNNTQSVGELFEELVRVGNNLHHYLKADSEFLFLNSAPDAEEQSRADAEVRISRQRTYLELLAVVTEALSNKKEFKELMADARQRLEKPEMVDMLVQVLPPWEFNVHNERALEQDLLLYQEKCLIIARMSEIGWEQDGRNFLGNARKLRDKLGTYKREDIEAAGVKDDITTSVDPHDWIVRVQMNALVSMYRAIPQHIKVVGEVMSDEEMGLFRKGKEITAVMDAAELVMQQRGGDIKGVVAVDRATLADLVGLIKLAFKDDDLRYEPQWDKRWATNKAMGIMTTSQAMQLLSVTTRRQGKDEETAEFSKISDFKGFMSALLPSEDEEMSDEQAQVVTKQWEDLVGAELIFNLKRMMEIEDQPLDRIKKGPSKGWHIHDTPMLNFFDAFGDNGEDRMTALCGGEASDPFVQKFIEYRTTLEENASDSLKRKLSALEHDGVITVDPNTSIAPGIVAYRRDKEKGTQLTIKQIGDLKRSNQATVEDYEKVHDNMKEYLERVKKKFWWSINVRKTVDEVEKGMVKNLKLLRSLVANYWNKQEGIVTAAAKAQEAKANAASAQADKDKQAAVQREVEAKKMEDRAKEKAAMAQMGLDEAKRQLGVANTAKAQAEQKGREAEAKMQQAQEELSISEEMLQTAERDKQAAKQAEIAAKTASTKAKEREQKVDLALTNLKKVEAGIRAQMKNLEAKKAEMKAAVDTKKADGEDMSYWEQIWGW